MGKLLIVLALDGFCRSLLVCVSYLDGTHRGLIGNPVQSGSGPAAVIGDESRRHTTVSLKRGGKVRQVE